MEHLDHLQEDPLDAPPARAQIATGDPPTSQLSSNPDSTDLTFFWNGTTATLRSFLTELAARVSDDDPTLAIQGYVTNSDTIIFPHRAQAAEQDGHLPRPEYTWTNATPTFAASFDDTLRVTVVARHAHLLRPHGYDPRPDLTNLDNLANIHSDTTRPLGQQYLLSLMRK